MRQKGLSPIIIVVVVAIIGIVIAYFLGKGKLPGQPTPTPTVTETPADGSASPSVKPTATTKAALKTATPTATTASTPTPSPTPTPDSRADLYISAYSFNHPPVQGEPFTVSVTIYNQGNVASGDFFWEWWATTSAPTWACRANVSSIAAHGGRVVTCTYTYAGWANYTTKAIADVDNGVDESNEGNNTFSQNVIPVH